MYYEATITKVLWYFTFVVLVVLLILQIIEMQIVVKNHAQESAKNNSSAAKTEDSIKIPVDGESTYELSFNDDKVILTPIVK